MNMNMWISHLYNKNKSVFIDFINRTNQKDIIANTVMENISWITTDSNLVITDIGAGSGIIASKILSGILGKYDSVYRYIEPSRELIAEFNDNHSYENVIFINEFIQNVDLPKSDVIIASFVFQAIWEKRNLLKKMYDALNAWWVIIMVNQNIETLDFRLKHLLWYSFADVTSDILFELDGLGIMCSHEIKDSYFYWVQDILSLNEIWKNCISFLLFKNFEHITPSEVGKVLDYIKKNSIDNRLVRREDYIYIRK